MFPVTSLDMYNLTLELLNKANTSSVEPSEWNKMANSKQTEIVLSLYRQYQLDQSVIDKLKVIIPEPVVIANTGAAVAEQEIFVLPTNYLRALNVGGKMNYVGEKCFADGPGIKVHPWNLLRDDEENIVDDNPYRKPNIDKIYYRQSGSEIRVKTGTSSYALTARLRYLRQPKTIDVTLSPGAGDCELPEDVKNDLCYLIAKAYIDQQESGRYNQIAQETKEIINN